jgi:hypothetical protein
MNERALRIETRAKILVAEDNEVCADIVKTTLLQENFEVTLAIDGLDALQLFASHQGHFSLVLSDFEMPRMNGFQLAKELLVIERRPFILMSGGLIPSDIERELSILNVDFISKPFPRQCLVQLINDSLAKDTFQEIS